MHRATGRATALLLTFSVLMLTAMTARADTALFPRPAELEHDIDFWVKVYTEVDTGSGYIHDSRRLDIIYARIDVPKGLSSRARQKQVDHVKKHYQAILRKLARADRDTLSPEEREVLALWPEDVSAGELSAATNRLRFQLGQSDRFREGLQRSGAWLEYISARFAALGLPGELAYLPHVESSFNPLAYSHAAAAGMWQFTRSTGRRYMRIDHVIDERMDPFFATDAAARLLRDNLADTGTWPLALTAYNHGAAGMRRAARRLGTTDIARVVREYKSRSFGFASRNFYVSFLAALQVHQNADQYFGYVERAPAQDPTTLSLDSFVSARALADALGTDIAVLERFNPSLRKAVWNGDKLVPKDYPLRIPPGHDHETFQAALAGIPDSQRRTSQYPDLTYRVARGDTLSQIAARFGVSVSALTQHNGLRSRHAIRAGQTLRLPQAAGRAAGMVASAEAPALRPADGTYRVRNGDSLSRIAQRFGVAEHALAASNDLRNKNRIYVGQTLFIPDAAQRGDLVKYTVRPGDTLSVLAARFGMRQSELAGLNGLSNKHRIYVGQTLQLVQVPADLPQPTSAPLTLSTGLGTGAAAPPVAPGTQAP